MVELYCKLFLEMSSESGEERIAEEPCHREEDRDPRDADLLVVWHSLEFFEKRAGRSMASAEFGTLKGRSGEKGRAYSTGRASLCFGRMPSLLGRMDGPRRRTLQAERLKFEFLRFLNF